MIQPAWLVDGMPTIFHRLRKNWRTSDAAKWVQASWRNTRAPPVWVGPVTTGKGSVCNIAFAGFCRSAGWQTQSSRAVSLAPGERKDRFAPRGLLAKMGIAWKKTQLGCCQGRRAFGTSTESLFDSGWPTSKISGVDDTLNSI